MKVDSLEDIPKRATIVKEYTRCGNPSCSKKHGPYMYAYWKEKGKLKKVYIGKSLKHLERRIMYQKIQKKTGLSFADTKRMIIITRLAGEGNTFAKDYFNRIDLKKCSPAWAYRKLSEHMKQLFEQQVGVEPRE